MKDFWQVIKRPIFALAPMEDVTDTVFREIVTEISHPGSLGVLFAEFTSTDGLCHEIGRGKVSHRLRASESEKKLLKVRGAKLVAQIWGGNPENFYKAAKMICEEYDFDGLDINMGCPVKKIVKQAACSELIKYPELAKEIILATKEAANIPVSVKTRTGIKEHNTEEWISHLLETRPAAITLHCRTQKMMSEKPADWEEIGKAANIIKNSGQNIPFLGNGDIFSMESALEKIEKYKIDGIMFGRGIFKSPWIFNPEAVEKTPEEKLSLLWRHASLFDKVWKREKNFAILRRFFKIYTFDFYKASEIRARLMQANSLEDVRNILEDSGYEVDFTIKAD